VKIDKDSDVREAAITKVTDQNILVDVAKNDLYGHVRKAAIAKVNNQSVLIDVAKSDEDTDVCKVALNKITDKNVVKELELILYKRIWVEESVRKNRKDLDDTLFRSKGGTASSSI